MVKTGYFTAKIAKVAEVGQMGIKRVMLLKFPSIAFSATFAPLR